MGWTEVSPGAGMPEGLSATLGETGQGFRTVGDRVTSTLREAILDASLPPGMRLRQDEVARRLGVSRMPVRSALVQLESEGLVEFHPYRGAIVAALDVDQVREAYEIRVHLESLAVAKAAQRLTPERKARLEAMADRLDAEDDPEQLARLRRGFFEDLYDIDAHPQLVGLIRRLCLDLSRYWRRTTGAANVRDICPGYRELLGMIADGEVAEGQRYLAEYLAVVRERLVALIEDAHPTAG